MALTADPNIKDSPTVEEHRFRRAHFASLTVLAAGLIVFGALSWLTYSANSRNNDRLLKLQATEAGSVLGAALPDIETPIASATALADATDGNVQQFRNFVAQYVGRGRPFVAESLWSLQGNSPQLIVKVGSAPALGAAQAAALFAQAKENQLLSVGGVLSGTHPRLAFGYVEPRSTLDFGVSAQDALPANKVATIPNSSAFSDLTFALYLGRSTQPSDLLEATTHNLPLVGKTESTTVPFGSSEFTFVATSTRELGGVLSEDLWWLIALLGTIATLVAVTVSERLGHRRQVAELLAHENGLLYAQQRGVAETLQHALLPSELPQFQGVETRAKYVPGVAGLEVGGDWYDVLQLDDHQLLFVIGDVSGRGLRAAAIMASLRYAIRAYALQGDPPATILAKLAEVVDIRRDGHFATVLCALIDTTTNEVVIANAGHPHALMRSGEVTDFLPTPVGPPIGAVRAPQYLSTTTVVAPGSIMIGFTDGLVERRGEHIDIGFIRLRDVLAAADPDKTLNELLTDIISGITPEGPSDDIALLGMRWRS